MTVLQEPVQAAIWQALNHYAYRDAVFLAERLYAEVHSEEALFLLATCYYRSGKAYKAYRLLKGHSCTTPQCKYLLAKCCVDLSKLAEGEQILSGGVFNKQKSHDDIVTEFGDSACFTLSLLGHVYCKTDRLAKGSECYQKSLSLNPFLWSPFESLCEIGEKPDPDQTFKLTSLQNFSNCLPSSCTTLVSNHSLSHRQPETVLTETPQDTIELNRLNLESSNSKYSLNTDSSVSYIDSAVISPDTVPLGTGTSILSKQVQNKPKTGRSLLGGPAALSPLTPSFGILPLETPSPGDGSYLQNYTNTSSVIDVPSTGAPSKKTFCVLQSVARIGQTGTKSVFSQSGNSREVTPILVAQTQSSGPQTSTTPQVLSPTITSPPNALPRRSSRLFTSDSSTTKENSKKLKMKFPPKIPNRKTKSKTNKGGITQPNINDSLEITKLDSSIISEGKISTITPQIQAFNLQKAAAEGLMSLLREMGKGYLALCSYNCKEAINILSHLPSHHYNTGWVLCQIGRAYFELSEYMQAERIFSEVRRIENYRVEGMEIYSTTLWHLQKDVALSVLSKDLTDMDKNSPEVQHALKKSEKALDTLNKAIVIDPKNPLCKFHRASVLFANEKYKSALQELEELKQIVPKESLVYFLIGKVYKKLGQTHLALMNFSWAMDLDPKGANNQIKEAIDKRYLPDDEEPITQEEQIMGTDESQESSMTDADDTQLHAAESDEF
ncbi:cell division cycle protein 27 homolog isoform X6 [Ailuropoda melanoleuca]|uniref:cell division cycle protein 27 homolog isoform X6 n=1 Tax=Ailuropoda melanoleuca TaxID=9646 RepID=UPI00149471CB|nr:cell division cycle protein 27 homolog isoform X6 [Ailuropoda melanoleuca]